ncbi:uroporphyrinogen-III synthase [Roseibium sp.]|uniref:uroporphyrinogen-III synthase n=1 Tax=Roseibium sp. TaxID=1936156 RepID=UPI003B5223D8
MRLLVTRPQPDCKRTADRLRALGHIADELPLLVFKPQPPEKFDLSNVSALAITSRRAVDVLVGHPQFPEMKTLPVFTVGDRTAEACRDVGFASVRSAESDVSGLASLILASKEETSGGAVLYPAAQERAGDLGELLETGGLRCQTVPVYRMEPVQDLPDTIAAALADGNYQGVLIFSRRTGETLTTLLKDNGLGHIFSSLPVYAISGQAAGSLGDFGCLYTAKVPREDALIDLVLANC